MSDPLATVSRVTNRDMVTFRGNFADPDCGAVLSQVTGCALPEMRKITARDSISLAWMSPDELLIICPEGQGETTAIALSEKCGARLHMAVNVSDARALFRMEGPGAREALARGAPVDLSTGGFGPGDFRRTRLGQVAVAFWMPDESGLYLVCFRSVADHVQAWLENAAQSPSAGFL